MAGKVRKKGRTGETSFIGRRLALSLGASAVLLALMALFYAWTWWGDNRREGFRDEFVVYVHPGADMSSLVDTLKAHSLRPSSIDRCSRHENLSARVKPGRYVIRPAFAPVQAVRAFCCGWQSPQKLVLSGTLRTRERIAQVIGRQMMADSLEIDRCLRDEAFLAQFGVTPETVFSMIVPDTYELWWTATPEEIFARLRRETDAFWTSERLAKAAALRLTPFEVYVLASIVTGETRIEADYPKIAKVYLNRLKKGMKLQACPTVCYIYDYKLTRVLNTHLKADSPYNTYRYAGLPPAPIAVAPKACIDAVLNPDSNDYLFFCASPAFDGTHRFACTYKEHSRNARDYQKALAERK